MIAKFSGACAHCGEPILKGSEMHYANKKAYHPVCANTGPEGPESESLALAAQLGFEPHGEVLGRALRILFEPAGNDDVAGSGACALGRETVWPVPRGPEDETE